MSVVEVEEDIIELDEEEDVYNNPSLSNNYNNNNKDVFNSRPYNELQRVLNEAVKRWTASSSVAATSNQKDNSFPNHSNKSLDKKMDSQHQRDSKNMNNTTNNNNTSKCIKEAEAEAAKAAHHGHVKTTQSII